MASSRRSAKRAFTRWSCVATISVAPHSRAWACEQVAGPAGSSHRPDWRSARRRAAACGRFITARAIATRWAWPCESWCGLRLGLFFKAETVQQAHRTGAVGWQTGEVGREQQVLQHAQAGHQVQLLQRRCRRCGRASGRAPPRRASRAPARRLRLGPRSAAGSPAPRLQERASCRCPRRRAPASARRRRPRSARGAQDLVCAP